MSSAIIKSFNGYNLCDQYARDKVDAINDYIVAQGTSGDWTYAKYNSGRAVMTCELALSSISANNGFGGIYRSGAQKVSLPFAITSTSECIVHANLVSTATAFAQGCAFNTNEIAILVFTASGSTFTGNAQILVEGRWK